MPSATIAMVVAAASAITSDKPMIFSFGKAAASQFWPGFFLLQMNFFRGISGDSLSGGASFNKIKV